MRTFGGKLVSIKRSDARVRNEMTYRRIQYAFAILIVLATSWNVDAQQISILKRTQAILAPEGTSSPDSSLALPRVRFYQSATETTAITKERRELTPEMKSLLAPPSLHPTHQNHTAETTSFDNHVSYAHAYATDHHSKSGFAPQTVINTSGVAPSTGDRYGFNPYATQAEGNLQQDDVEKPRRRIFPPRISETRANNSFSQISTSDFAELRDAVPLDTVQDPEDPGQPQTDNTQQQDQSDTQPRPLPDDLKPPTELPIPTNDSNPSQQDPEIEPRNPINPEGQGGVVYPDRALPGRQSYPGPTAEHQPPFVQGNPVPTNPRQTIYPPRERKIDLPNFSTYPQNQQRHPLPPTVFPQEQRIHPENNLVYPILPNHGLNSQGGYPSQSPSSEYQPIFEQAPPVPIEHAQQSIWSKQKGWRPQLALGVEPEAPQFDSCNEPLFYLSAFGGISNSDDLDGGLPPAGTTAATFNLDDGANFGLVFGQFQGRNLRTEFEYAFRHNDVESIQLTENTGAGLNLTSFNLAGEIKAHSGMANVVWEFNNGNGRFIRPYIGTGVGFVFMDVNATRAGLDVLVAGQDGNSSFAYQWFAGINTQLSNEMDIFVEYRYFYADDLRLQTNLANVNGGAGILSSRFDYNTSNVNFGIRFKF